MVLDKIEATTLRQQAYDKLTQAIMSGSMPPGFQFSLRGLASSLGVSTMPVREALWQLENDRVVVIESNKRMLINTLNVQEVHDLFSLREFLELELALRACRKRSEGVVRDTRAAFGKMEANVHEGRLFLAWNKEFHFSIYQAGESDVYLNTVRSLWLRVAPYFSIQNLATHNPRVTPHRTMLEGLAGKDESLMKEGLLDDLRFAQEFILSTLSDESASVGPPQR